MQIYLCFLKWIQPNKVIIPLHFNKVEEGYTGSPCLSICLSVCGQNRLCSVSSKILARAISYLHILSSNFRKCFVCKVFAKFQNLNFGKFLNFVTLTLSCFHIILLNIKEVIQNFGFQDVLRRDWMFKLVGRESFEIGKTRAKGIINIEAVSGFAYEYSIEVNGKSLKKFRENQSKIMRSWVLMLDGIDTRVVLGESGYNIGSDMLSCSGGA